MNTLRTLVVLTLGAGSGVAAAASAHVLVPTSPFARGVTIAGEAPPSRGDARQWLSARARLVRERTVELRAGDQVFRTTLAELGVDVEPDKTLAEARAVAHHGSLTTRFREGREARKRGVDVPYSMAFDTAVAREKLAALAASLHRDPVDAKLDLDNHAKIPDVPGQELDVEATLKQVALAPHLKDGVVVYIVTRPVEAKVALADLVAVDVSKVVSSFETTFVTWGVGVGRSINIKNAASFVDGTILAPGAMMSFNDKVGPRTKERGFALAPEIQGDDLTQGYGGGTCQMSSTLHAASLFGALEIVERQGHSRPSSYTKMGLDATVSYPLADLKIRNTLPFPILIHAYLPKPTSIRVEILGGDPIAKVDYAYGVGSTEDFMRRVVVKSFLPSKSKIRHQKGIRGFDVSSVVTVHYTDGRADERRYFTGYRPAPEIFWIAADVDPSELPPLPEHAKGLEGSGGA